MLRTWLVVVLALAAFAIGKPAPVAAAPDAVKVAIIVGPVGDELTPQYLDLAELAAATAIGHGATVARAYSPNATPERVMDAVAGADVIIYFGHGTGFPNPYSDQLVPERVNGWALQGPSADGRTHADTLNDGRMRYYGEAWLEANLRPAPGFVMIYSNACYAPGASEGRLPPPDEGEALAHVANYSRPVFALGGSAYFATDFYAGAAGLLDRLLQPSPVTFGQAFQADKQFRLDALTVRPHPLVSGAEVWLHRSAYFGGQVDYWYAFAGNPTIGFGKDRPGAAAAAVSVAGISRPLSTRAVTGVASSYGFTAGMEDRATVALPVALGGKATLSINGWVVVCADRCAVLPVVDSCPCYWGTADQRIANLSLAAWALVSDMPLEEGLIDVRLYLDDKVPAGEAPSPIVMTMRAVPPAPPGD